MSILITGATGFLASHFLLRHLLEEDGPVVCIARNTLREKARERVRRALAVAVEHADLMGERDRVLLSFDERVRVVAGDIEKPNCGLAEKERADIRVEEVWHFASMLRFSIKLKVHVERAVVLGTANVCELAEASGARVFNYLSSAIVAGNQVGRVDEVLHESLDTADTAYELAKRRAECDLAERCSQGSMRYRIFRPGVVVGHSRTMRGQTDTGIYGLITICAKLKNEIESKIPGFLSKHPIKLFQPKAGAELNLIHVDEVIRQLRVIGANRSKCLDRIFHIVNRYQVPMETLVSELENVMQIKVGIVSSLEQFEPLDHLVRKQMGEYEKYFQNRYEFRTENADAALGVGVGGRVDVQLSREQIRGLIEIYYGRFMDEDSRATLFRSPLESFEKRHVKTSAGSDLTYYVGGSGPINCLIINAYGQSIHFWTELFNLMLSEYRVHVWEIRGTSVTDGGMSEHFTVRDHIDDAIRILEAEDLRDCHLIGWCTGGKLGLEVSARAPERVRSVTCLTPSFKGLAGESMDTSYEQNMEPICRLVNKQPSQAKLVQKFIGDFFAGARGDGSRADGIDENVTNIMSMVSRTVRPLLVAPFVSEESILNYARQLVEFWAHDVSHLYGRITRPILLLTGEKDGIASPELAHKVIPRFGPAAGFKVLDGSHYVHKDSYLDVKRMLDGFVEHGIEVLAASERLEQIF